MENKKHQHKIVAVRVPISEEVGEKFIDYLNDDYEIVNTATPNEGGVIYILCKKK